MKKAEKGRKRQGRDTRLEKYGTLGQVRMDRRGRKKKSFLYIFKGDYK